METVKKGFNRTFMELKYRYYADGGSAYKKFQSYLYGIEICSQLHLKSLPGCFNRTFMELK